MQQTIQSTPEAQPISGRREIANLISIPNSQLSMKQRSTINPRKTHFLSSKFFVRLLQMIICQLFHENSEVSFAQILWQWFSFSSIAEKNVSCCSMQFMGFLFKCQLNFITDIISVPVSALNFHLLVLQEKILINVVLCLNIIINLVFNVLI